MSEARRDRGGRPFRIAVCDADGDSRNRIEASLVLGGHQIAASTDSLPELIESARSVEPDAVVLGCGLDPFMRLRDISILRAELTEVPLVFVADRFFPRTARKLISANADGLVYENDIERALVATVDAVLAQQLCVPGEMRGRLAQPVLTHREKQALELVAGGLSNREIANRLFLSESTVKSHLASSFRKLGVSSRTEVAQLLLDHDLCLQPGAETEEDVVAHTRALLP
jgi:DNA-binding NarL/FixJ family response regulator